MDTNQKAISVGDTNSKSPPKFSGKPIGKSLAKAGAKSTESIPQPNEFTVVFKGEALEKLEELASYLHISSNKLGDVLVKGIHIIDMARDCRIIIESPQKKFEINLKEL